MFDACRWGPTYGWRGRSDLLAATSGKLQHVHDPAQTWKRNTSWYNGRCVNQSPSIRHRENVSQKRTKSRECSRSSEATQSKPESQSTQSDNATGILRWFLFVAKWRNSSFLRQSNFYHLFYRMVINWSSYCNIFTTVTFVEKKIHAFSTNIIDGIGRFLK